MLITDLCLQPCCTREGQGLHVLPPEARTELGDRPSYLWMSASQMAEAAQGQSAV